MYFSFINYQPYEKFQSMLFQWRRKFAKSGGAILLERKYFYGKN